MENLFQDQYYTADGNHELPPEASGSHCGNSSGVSKIQTPWVQTFKIHRRLELADLAAT